MLNYEDVSLYSGGGGLVSTAADYMRFSEMLRNKGRFGERQILSPKTVKYMTINHLSLIKAPVGSGESPTSAIFQGAVFGLGFGVVVDPVAQASLGSRGTFMWGGAAGTVFWVDPVEDIVVIAMIQMIGGALSLREDLGIATYQAIIDSHE